MSPIRLFEAIIGNNLAEVTNLVTQGIQHPLDTEPTNKWTSLHIASLHSSEDGNVCSNIAELLINNGAEVLQEDSSNRSPLILGLEKPHNSINISV